MPTSGNEVAPARARVLLARSVIPRAYTAVRCWAAASGVDDIVDFYLDQAAANPDYLGHRLSILLAFGEAWPIYRHSPYRDLYLDRLVEFLVACRFTAGQVGTAPAAADWEHASSAALLRPGFFGHNLICLSWIGRRRLSLSETQLKGGLGWVVNAAERTHPDEEDNVRISPAPGQDFTESVLEATLQELLLQGVRNLHLLTLADAIAWLWDALTPEARPYLIGVARHYVNGQGEETT